MDAIKTHKDLIVWRKAVALASAVYAATRSSPAEERFGLDQQLRRAAVSIASSIAEGSARRTTAELLQFLHVARGSLADLETHAMIAMDQGHFDIENTITSRIAEVGELLDRLLRSVALAKRRAHARACLPFRTPTSSALRSQQD